MATHLAETEETEGKVLTPFIGESDPPYVASLDQASNWPQRLAAMAEYHVDTWLQFGPWKNKKAAQNTASNLNGYWMRGGWHHRGLMLESVAGWDAESGWCLWLRVRHAVSDGEAPANLGLGARWRG